MFFCTLFLCYNFSAHSTTLSCGLWLFHFISSHFISLCHFTPLFKFTLSDIIDICLIAFSHTNVPCPSFNCLRYTQPLLIRTPTRNSLSLFAFVCCHFIWMWCLHTFWQLDIFQNVIVIVHIMQLCLLHAQTRVNTDAQKYV